MSEKRRPRETIREMVPRDADTSDECLENPDGHHCDHWATGDDCGCCHCGGGALDLLEGQGTDMSEAVPFGPTRSVPKGRQWCMSCDGEGRTYHGAEDEKRTCDVCDGAGHWGADEIRNYHHRAPEVCRMSCGETHVEWAPPMTAEEFAAWRKGADALLAHVDGLLKKFGG